MTEAKMYSDLSKAYQILSNNNNRVNSRNKLKKLGFSLCELAKLEEGLTFDSFSVKDKVSAIAVEVSNLMGLNPKFVIRKNLNHKENFARAVVLYLCHHFKVGYQVDYLSELNYKSNWAIRTAIDRVEGKMFKSNDFKLMIEGLKRNKKIISIVKVNN